MREKIFKSEEMERIEAAEKVLKEAEGHPLMQKIMADKADSILKERQAAAEEIQRIEAEGKTVLSPLQKKLASLLEDLKKAEEKVKTIQNQVNNVKRDISSMNFSLEHRKARAEAILLDCYDPRIDEAIQFFRDTLDDLRKPGRIVRVGRKDQKNLVKWTKKTTAESNRDAVLGAMRYCQTAIKSLEGMKLKPEFNVKRIEDMKSGVPSIDTYTESTGEKPMERINTDPRSLLPSDDQLEWEMKKLDEKYKKVMKK